MTPAELGSRVGNALLALSDQAEAKAQENVTKVLALAKDKAGVEPGRLGHHWIELGRYSGAMAAVQLLFERGLLNHVKVAELAGISAEQVVEVLTACQSDQDFLRSIGIDPTTP